MLGRGRWLRAAGLPPVRAVALLLLLLLLLLVVVVVVLLLLVVLAMSLWGQVQWVAVM